MLIKYQDSQKEHQIMARFIGSSLKEVQSKNSGEHYLITKLIKYFDDRYVIYWNHDTFDAEFDICLLMPGKGIIIFEVKAWHSETVKMVENGDTIVIGKTDPKTGRPWEARHNPTKQYREYVHKMQSRIREITGKQPLVFGMTCFTNLTKSDFESKGIDRVCEYENTLLKEDLKSKQAFNDKINLGMRNHREAWKYRDEFSPELMYRVRLIFETDPKMDDEHTYTSDAAESDWNPQKAAYSLLAYVPQGEMDAERIQRLSSAYSSGTKLYVITESHDDLQKFASAILKTIRDKGLSADGQGLRIDFSGTAAEPPVGETSFQVFNCAAYCSAPLEGASDCFDITDGKNISEDQLNVLKQTDRSGCGFNLAQYSVEHADPSSNIIVKAGAGTGKTFTMISRIAYICHMQDCQMREMPGRIVMITFTNDAAEQMKKKIRQHFSSLYLLTRDSDCLAFVSKIEGMQISTIHSYAKKIISVLGLELGYGASFSVKSSDYKIRQIIEAETDRYIKEKLQAGDKSFMKNLGMPVYRVNSIILKIIAKLRNHSIDIAALTPHNFGESISDGDEGEFHRLICEIVPKVGKEADDYFKKENCVHLSSMMSILNACLENDNNQKRLTGMQSRHRQYMFVDEFQDTDDVQIDALKKISKLLNYTLFAVGDVKQCIYRFRGAKEDAFSRLKEDQDAKWQEFSLSRNYRTDSSLLDIFHETFWDLGCRRESGEPQLMYSTEPESADRLIGTRNYNDGFPESDFYKKIPITSEKQRLKILFDEVSRQMMKIKQLEDQGKKLSDSEREIAILVRENWQAEAVKQAGKKKNLDIITDTGGDLYMSAPALDMLTLTNALLHYDEPDYLYAFVSSNFIDGGMCKPLMYRLRINNRKSDRNKYSCANASQTEELQKIINLKLSSSCDGIWSDWNSIVRLLRTMPVLQVVRKVYGILKPWNNYGGNDNWKREYYRLNVDLLIEEMINTTNMASLSVNSMARILTANITGAKNADCRTPDDGKHDCVIRCVTVHKSKGLEYGAVILPYCSDNIDRLKSHGSSVSVKNGQILKIGYQIKTEGSVYQNEFFDEPMETGERKREESRILYVAMTRAIRSFSWIALEDKKYDCWQNLIWENESDAV